MYLYSSPFIYLHGGIVHDHVIKFDIRISSRHLFTALQEKAIAKLPMKHRKNYPKLIWTCTTGSLFFCKIYADMVLSGYLGESKAELSKKGLSHDISFMYCRDLATAFLSGQVKGILSNPQWIHTRYDLQTLHHPGNILEERRFKLEEWV